jgi:hypothetical protein
MLNIFIFRQAVSFVNKMQMSFIKALYYHMFHYYFQRLDIATDFMQILQPYDIWREMSNELNNVSHFFSPSNA